jgi:hypothetical protein
MTVNGELCAGGRYILIYDIPTLCIGVGPKICIHTFLVLGVGPKIGIPTLFVLGAEPQICTPTLFVLSVNRGGPIDFQFL